ncbi:SGNH/GDSL hydrolase family protein [Agromyces aerolatus]|uniref:SGNH/GDSL hydrolase family protein n=1 Tax=Agromyces sp. LY-1074 TaxID=3074080 RepID=UPI002857E5DC|nr:MULTISPECIES: SGNH/GDSL hydrolase family protein [unclassified Agromyces]MDR5701575.1 SGNH/GDSL hydrolase family protein [Agromyces sp. LY-1074]MDR5706105.1 SGNH/GDSL hydrolase family protein [Agromyces sp. LY-1358]
MDLRHLLLGVDSIDEGRMLRVPASAMERWAADTIQAARVPAGARIGFTGDAEAVEVDVRTGDALQLATPAEHGEFTVYVDGERRQATRVEDGTAATVRVELPARDPGARVEIHVPERAEPRIFGVRALGGEARPLEPGPRWVAYGDSITQGWTTSDPGAAWTAVAARATGFDLLNLGFAGAARGELPVAAHLAATPADVISLAWGTNCWAQIEMDAAYIRELMRLFLAMVRAGHAETPILVVSPVIRPNAEQVRNGSGATLADLRAGLEDAVHAFQDRNGDANLHLLPGVPLISADQLDPDGIHPNDAGHAAIGAAVAERLRQLRP